jgi:hypothetical protein
MSFSKNEEVAPQLPNQDNPLRKFLIAFVIIFIFSIIAWIFTNFAGGVISFLVLGIIVLNSFAKKDDQNNNRGRFRDSDFE